MRRFLKLAVLILALSGCGAEPSLPSPVRTCTCSLERNAAGICDWSTYACYGNGCTYAVVEGEKERLAEEECTL